MNEVSYLAGMIDGDGTIVISTDTSIPHYAPYHSVLIQVGNKSERLMQWLKDQFGGKCYRESGGQWKWQADRSDRQRILSVVREYLIVKEPQAWLALEYMEQCPPWQRGGKPRDEERLALEEGFSAAMQYLNSEASR